MENMKIYQVVQEKMFSPEQISCNYVRLWMC